MLYFTYYSHGLNQREEFKILDKKMFKKNNNVDIRDNIKNLSLDEIKLVNDTVNDFINKTTAYYALSNSTKHISLYIIQNTCYGFLFPKSVESNEKDIALFNLAMIVIVIKNMTQDLRYETYGYVDERTMSGKSYLQRINNMANLGHFEMSGSPKGFIDVMNKLQVFIKRFNQINRVDNFDQNEKDKSMFDHMINKLNNTNNKSSFAKIKNFITRKQ
jgi:hypothetical protein